MHLEFQKGHLTFIYYRKRPKNFLTLIAPFKTYYFLSDRVFNQNKVSLFEASMRGYFHAYYFNEETGLHYDQFEVISAQRRVRLSNPIPLKLEEIPLKSSVTGLFPFSCRSSRRTGLSGDLMEGEGSLNLLRDCLNSYLNVYSK